MLARMIREIKTRMVILVVDDRGMSTVEYSIGHNYNHESTGIDCRPTLPSHGRDYLS